MSEQNVIPEWAAKLERGRPAAYPWTTMSIGGVFSIPTTGRVSSLVSLRSMASIAGKRYGRKFKCRQLVDGSFEVARVE